jgi:hypothetical protein
MVVLKFSAEELLFLLSVLKIKTLAGLGEDPAAGLNEEQLAMARAAGFNSLRARGLVGEQPDQEKTLAVDNIILALLGTCVRAQQLILLNRQLKENNRVMGYVYTGSEMTTVHEVNEPGVHTFIGIIGQQQTKEYVASWLNLNEQSAPADEVIRIPEEELERVTGAALEKRNDEAITILQKQGASVSVARKFVESLHSTRSNTMVAMAQIQHDNTQRQAKGFNLIEDTKGFWIMKRESLDDPASPVQLIPASASDCKKELETLFPGHTNTAL